MVGSGGTEDMGAVGQGEREILSNYVSALGGYYAGKTLWGGANACTWFTDFGIFHFRLVGGLWVCFAPGWLASFGLFWRTFEYRSQKSANPWGTVL